MPTTLWNLVDQYDSIENTSTATPVPIQSEEHLRRLLEQAKEGPPKLLIFMHPIGHRLFVGIGGALAGLLHYDNDKFIDGHFAVPQQQYSQDPAVFISEESPTAFPAKALMPVEYAINMICEIITRDSIPRSVSWILARSLMT